MYRSPNDPLSGIGRDRPADAWSDAWSDAGRLPASSAACTQVDPLLEAFHDGALDADWSQFVAQHISGCARCYARLQEYAQTDRLVREAPAPRADPSLRRMLYARIADAGGVGAPLGPWSSDATADLEDLPTERLPAAGQRRLLFPGRIQPGRPLRPPAAWLSGGAIAAVVLALVLIFVTLPRAHSGAGSPRATSTSAVAPSATAQSTVFNLPAFHDWRAAYLHSDGTVHVVSLDGASDLTGPALPNLDSMTRQVSVSPDGRFLAYIANPKYGPIVIASLATNSPARTVQVRASDFAWSPDGSRLATDAYFNDVNGVYVVGTPASDPVLVPGTQNGGPLQYSQVVGWFDASHLAVLASATATALQPSPSPTARAPRSAGGVPLALPLPSGPLTLASVDVSTGKAVAIAAAPAGPSISFSPDGKEVLLQNGPLAGAPASPSPISLIDTATGQIHSVSIPDLGVAGAVWEPGALVVANSVYAAPPQQTHVSLVDLQRMTETPIQSDADAIAWSPDGQTLLLVDTTQTTGTNSTLYALTPVAASARRVTLTQSFVRFLGLVRTA
jgi:anti-sigma factor RsiW